MTYDDWTPLYKRLCAAKEHKPSGEQLAALFDALKDFPTSCVHQAVFRASREVPGWPKSDRLVELARDERRKVQGTPITCARCHGETWVDDGSHRLFERDYEQVRRCPECWTLGSAA